MNLSEAIKKRKKNLDPNEAMLAIAESYFKQKLSDLEPVVQEAAKKEAQKLVDKRVKELLKGEKGETGEGRPGRDGRDGKDATNIQLVAQEAAKLVPKPRDGIDGAKGERGVPGYTPREGIDYPSTDTLRSLVEAMAEKALAKLKKEIPEPETPDEIVDKVITSKKLIPVSKISGLREALAVPRGGSRGGGMGNVVHDQFTGNNSTTSFTLSDKVAGSGNAVFACRYQGQVLYLGDQFTISGKTLTVVGFTPATGTKIEVTYIRG